MDFQSIDFARVLKWTLIVLITGFIAQFGKSFATYLLGKLRLRRTAGEKGEEKNVSQSAPQSSNPLQNSLGIEMREIPTHVGEVPAAEKQEPGETQGPLADLDEKDQAKLKKKALKAQLKQRKKAAKNDENYG